MNILFINSISADKFGGGEKWMIKAARCLREAGHGVWIASKNNAEILKRAAAFGVPTVEIGIYADFSPLKTLRVKRFLQENKVDVLVCNLNKDVRVAGLGARLAGDTVVIARHGVQLIGNEWKHKATLTRLTDGMVTNTQSIRETYESFGWFPPNHIRVIYNGIEDKSAVRAHDFSQDYPGRKVLFAAGRLSNQKGFEYLIDAAALLRARRDDFVVLIAGKGKEEESLRARIRDKGLEDVVHLLGFREDTESLTKGADLFVLSSLYEGMPNVVMEAMAVGKAVVATDVNGVRELMRDGETGLIVPSRDSAALAEAIARVLDDPQKLAQMGEAGLKRVREHFTIPGMVKKLEAFFQEKLDEKRGRNR
ncbi:MAG: glycosyltransferase family 1 protein [Calditrichaeota bacterium]|nr:MAG: glycosyltransferase family 1 protein [Calditrichota bacterium]